MPRHLLSVDQFTTEHLSRLFQLTERLQRGSTWQQVPRGTVSTNLFYEPSTRTSSSFYSAMVKLGGSVIPINDVNFSSVSKGETLEDTVRVMAGYCDAIVLRHPQKGAVARAAAVSPVPVINAGDGVGEHPTQALLDLYTIYQKVGLRSGLKVALVGDLAHGRTVHSLLKLLRLYDAEVHLVSPRGLEMPKELTDIKDTHHRDLWGCISEVDVVYMTRVQRERIPDPALASQLGSYEITLEMMNLAQPHMILMHPLPRMEEISTVIDRDPRAIYFEQSANGLFVRQAIFLSLFEPAAAWLSMG